MHSSLGIGFLFFLISFQIYAQEVLINAGVDTIDLDKKKIVELWTNYLKSKPDSLYNNPFWNSNEKRIYKSYDLLGSEGFLKLYIWNKQNIILSVKRLGHYYVVRSLFHYRGTDTGNINISAIVNVIAQKEGNEFRLYNCLPFHTNDWLKRNVGIINYIYHPQHVFDEGNALQANSFLKTISAAFNFKVDTLTYYIAPTCDDLHKMKGLDYVFTMGSLDNCGTYDEINKIVYATTPSGENHQHELMHVINENFPNAHGLILAGISAYWGGDNAHLGKPLIYHIKRVSEYLQAHPEIDLGAVTDFYSLDSKTNPQYVMGGILCHLAIQKGGMPKLKELLNCGNEDSDLLTFIRDELGISQKNINSVLRKTINDFAKKDSFEVFSPEKDD